jgi:hypothetical protein
MNRTSNTRRQLNFAGSAKPWIIPLCHWEPGGRLEFFNVLKENHFDFSVNIRLIARSLLEWKVFESAKNESDTFCGGNGSTGRYNLPKLGYVRVKGQVSVSFFSSLGCKWKETVPNLTIHSNLNWNVVSLFWTISPTKKVSDSFQQAQISLNNFSSNFGRLYLLFEPFSTKKYQIRF